MATFYLEYTEREAVSVAIVGLQYTLDQYGFKFKFTRNAYTNETWDVAVWYPDTSYSPYNGLTGWKFTGLLPNTSYKIECLVEYPKYSGTWYTFTIDSATTQNINPATSDYLPSYYPFVRDQMIYKNGTYQGEAGSCVAQSSVCILDILEKRERGTNNNYYSATWIYGNRTYSGESMQFVDTINKLNSDGSPVWDRMNDIDNYPDNRFYSDNSGILGARNVFLNNYNDLYAHAKNQRTNGDTSTNISFYDCQTIMNVIQTNGCCFFGIQLPSTFDNPVSGKVNNPSSNYTRGGHAVVAIGWKMINGVAHWICQNSWGSGYGDGGRCYIPMSWGIGATHVSSWFGWRWCHDVYSISNTVSPIPTAPSSPTLMTNGRIDGGLKLQWNYMDYADDYTLRYKNYNGVYYTQASIKNNTTLTGLEYGVTYYISVKSNNYKGASAYSTENQATTAPKIPTIARDSAGLTSLTVNISGMQGNWSFIKLWYKEVGTTTWNYITIQCPSSQSPTAQGTITGLVQGKSYNIKASSFFTVNGVDLESVDSAGAIGYSNILTEQLSSRPQNFNWTTNIVTGGAIYEVQNKNLKIITAQEWNDFTSRINAFRQYKGLSNYTFTSVVSGTAFTAVIYNQARNALNDLNAYITGGNVIPSTVSTGIVITANHLLALKSALNSIQ